ncbi:MAG TPA: RNA polymerase sigma-70 factor [Candidatus Barnesiella excrementigallinarum]|nr:RNA polymerase sigma-70 factor [Candidatus Barnesiella excrementigallinarum]
MAENRDFHSIFNDTFSQRDRFIRFALCYVINKEIAEDIVMDSFMYFWENRDKIETEKNLGAYILIIIKHKCLDYLKQQKIHKEVQNNIYTDSLWDLNMSISTLEAFDPYKVFSPDYQEMVQAAFSKLPEKTKKIFMLSRIENLSYEEIAQKSGLSVKSIEYHISKALKILRKELKEFFPTIFLFL